MFGEVSYGPARSRRKTVDWIVVLPVAVLLVEVKSAIPTEPVRLIADRNPALAVVPAGRPVLGLAVTLEPFHIANAGFDVPPATRTPVIVADAAEIETLATVTGISPGQLLLDRAADESAPLGRSTPRSRASPATGTRSSTKPGTPTRGHQPPAHIVTHRAEPGAPQGRQPRHLTCQNSGSH